MDGTTTKMISKQTDVGKYYKGSIDTFNTSLWDTYTVAPKGSYLVRSV